MVLKCCCGISAEMFFIEIFNDFDFDVGTTRFFFPSSRSCLQSKSPVGGDACNRNAEIRHGESCHLWVPCVVFSGFIFT